MVSEAEEALYEQSPLFPGLWQIGEATNAGMPSGRNDPKRTSPGKRRYSAVPSSKKLVEVFKSSDADYDHELNLQEMVQGMKESGIPTPDNELKQLVNLVDSNHDGTVNAGEFMAAAEAQAAMLSARAGENPPEGVMRRKIFREAFEQEVLKLIDSFIARDMHKSNSFFPKWAAFVERLQHEGIRGYAAKDVLMALYKQCGTHGPVSSGLHEQCILGKLYALIGQDHRQDVIRSRRWGNFPTDLGRTFFQVSVEKIFAQLQHLIQTYLKPLNFKGEV